MIEDCDPNLEARELASLAHDEFCDTYEFAEAYNAWANDRERLNGALPARYQMEATEASFTSTPEYAVAFDAWYEDQLS